MHKKLVQETFASMHVTKIVYSLIGRLCFNAQNRAVFYLVQVSCTRLLRMCHPFTAYQLSASHFSTRLCYLAHGKMTHISPDSTLQDG